MLDPDVVFRIDAGGVPSRARPAVVGAEAVARDVLQRAPRFARFARPAIVNGTAGFLVASGRKAIGVVGFAVSNGRITEIDLVADPDKLRGLVLEP